MGMGGGRGTFNIKASFISFMLKMDDNGVGVKLSGRDVSEEGMEGCVRGRRGGDGGTMGNFS